MMPSRTVRRACSSACSALLLALAAGVAPLRAQEAPVAVETDRDWVPLESRQFGRELTAAWIPVPNGESGAPRQGWLNTADGFFTREAHLAYDYVDGDDGDAHQVLARFHHPLSRRLWAGLEVPFYQEAGGRSDFGDVTLTTQLMLAETRNLSLNAGVGWRIPTGSASFGNNVFAVQPQLNIWTDLGGGFSGRGRIAYEFADSGGRDSFVLNAALGQTVTPHDAAPFGDLSLYVAGNWREPSQAGGASFVSVTPGLRTHVGGNLFLLAGVEFPITRTSASFDQRFILQLVQGF